MTKEKINKSNLEWQKILSENEYRILREEGTERAFTNKLYNENREGNYYCKGCDTKLFSSEMKFDSGTGWPSFFDSYLTTQRRVHATNRVSRSETSDVLKSPAQGFKVKEGRVLIAAHELGHLGSVSFIL